MYAGQLKWGSFKDNVILVSAIGSDMSTNDVRNSTSDFFWPPIFGGLISNFWCLPLMSDIVSALFGGLLVQERSRYHNSETSFDSLKDLVPEKSFVFNIGVTEIGRWCVDCSLWCAGLQELVPATTLYSVHW